MPEASSTTDGECGSGARRLRRGLGVALAAALGLLGTPVGGQDASDAAATQSIRLFGMTYVSSSEARNELVLDAARARVLPSDRKAHLEEVRARMASGDEAGSLELRCDRGSFELATGDFVAEGDVRGTTAGGRRFRTERLIYHHEEGLVSTDRPVLIEDETGTYSGGGFLYHVREDRFRMIGGAELVQGP